MKIPRKTREQAAVLCSMWASSDPEGMGEAAYAIGIPTTAPAWRLAMEVGSFIARQRVHVDNWRAYHAECESALRTGWTP